VIFFVVVCQVFLSPQGIAEQSCTSSLNICWAAVSKTGVSVCLEKKNPTEQGFCPLGFAGMVGIIGLEPMTSAM
jgi:hypothetical protein